MRTSRSRPSPRYGIADTTSPRLLNATRDPSDELVAAICDREERILLTFDKDFGNLVFRRGLSSGYSVVLFRIMPEPGLVAGVIHSLVDTGILTAGMFYVVARDRVRVRPLPTPE